MLSLDDKTSVIKNSFVLYLGSDSDSDDSPRKKKKKKDKKKRKKHKKVNIAWDLKDMTMLLPIMINRITPLCRLLLLVERFGTLVCTNSTSTLLWSNVFKLTNDRRSLYNLGNITIYSLSPPSLVNSTQFHYVPVFRPRQYSKY